ncbi:glycosyltransferase family 2 protein [Candidatus Pacearchaeota archaeon]|nr:glycosyltransferase family 2 protein [Candidatus Pacearchaeota archaeon]
MEFLTILYLTYTFIAFYFLMIYILVYTQNRKQIYETISPDKTRSLSIIIPCFNAEENIAKTIQAHLNSDYKGLKKIIVVDDCSTDNSATIIKQLAKKHKKVMYVKTPKNTGNAAGAKNYGSKFVKTKLIGFSDDDSMPKKNAVSKMVGFFNDEKVGAVTSRVLIKGKQNFLTKSQAIEYKIIAFTRKLLGFLESIYVTNGPLSIYRKKAFDQVGGFDQKNLTEDIEITWHFVSKGWKVHMVIPAIVYTYPPTTIKSWFHQRIRWNVGGIQTVAKYRKKFFQCGMLGLFIMPFFILSWFLGITGLFFLAYRFTKHIMVKYLVAKYSVAANVALITMNDISLNPSILFFFGMLLFALGLIYTITALTYSKESGKLIGHKIRDIFIYSIFYLLMYPPLLIVSFYKYMRGYNTW